MKRSGPHIISTLRENLQLNIGRHLYGVLGTYASLKKFEAVDLAQARFSNEAPAPPAVNLNLALLDRIADSEMRSLVQNEARLPQTVQRKLNAEFDQFLQGLLQEAAFIILKQVELLFAYNLDLHAIRARATNQKHILLLLPGEKRGDHITIFSEADARFHRSLPTQLITENHLWELADAE